MPDLRHPLQNFFWLIGERVGRAMVTATVLGLVARHLEPAGFGRLNFAVTLVGAAAALASFGLEGLVVSEIVRRPKDAGAVLGTAIRLRFVAALGTALLLYLGGLATVPADAGLLAIVGLGLLFQPAEIVDLLFQRHLDSRRTVVARTVAVVVGALLKLALVAASAPLVAFAWAQAADVALIALALFIAAKRSPYLNSPWTWDPALARDLARRGLPLALAALALSLSMRVDQVLVRQWLGDKEAGIYFASTRLIDLANFAGSALALSLFPAMAAAHTRSRDEFHLQLQGMLDALAAVGWAVAIGCTVAGPWIIRLVFGEDYAGAAKILLVQGWFSFFALSATGRWQYMILAEKTLLNLLAAGLHVALVLAVSCVLLPEKGAIGAAIALLIGAVVSGYGLGFAFPSLRSCAIAQTRAMLVPLSPKRWPSLLRQLSG